MGQQNSCKKLNEMHSIKHPMHPNWVLQLLLYMHVATLLRKCFQKSLNETREKVSSSVINFIQLIWYPSMNSGVWYVYRASQIIIIPFFLAYCSFSKKKNSAHYSQLVYPLFIILMLKSKIDINFHLKYINMHYYCKRSVIL